MKTTRLIITAMALAMCTAAGAADFGGKKFYINPGHGGHDSDDRPTPMPLGVAMFYESDGTLTRGKYLKTFFTSNNGQAKLSRTTNTTADDLPLSTIAAQSNSYGGWFMSLHTNAGTASANYMVAFYRGGTPGTVSGAQAFTTAAVNWHNDNHMTSTTYATPRAMTDYSFYGYNLGVLRTNNRPGYLVESWFHDYRPEGLRLKTDAYNKYLAWQLCRAAKDSPGATGNLKGCIIGDIRDTNKSCGYTNYASRGRDSYLAINGATVTLRDASGNKVASTTTSSHCNGIYAFFDVTAGTYTVEVKKTGYQTKTATVTVANNAATKKNFSLKEGADTGLQAASTSHDFGVQQLGATAQTWSVKITGTGLSSAIAVTSSSADFKVSATSLAAAGGTLTITFNPTTVGSKAGTVTLKSGTITEKISLTGIAREKQLRMKKKIYLGDNWSDTQEYQNMPSWIPKRADGTPNWNKLRNMAYGNGKLYVTNPTDGIIYVVKAQTFEHLYNLDMTGVDGGTYKIMDVKVKGSKIVACNLTTDAEQPTKVYVWDNDFAKPKVLLNTTSRNGIVRMGDAFEINGNLTSGRIVFAGKAGSGNTAMRYWQLVDGKVGAAKNYKVLDKESNMPAIGVSPRFVRASTSKYWFNSSSTTPLLVDSTAKNGVYLNPTIFNEVPYGNDIVNFKYKGESYAAAVTYMKNGETCSSSTTRTYTATGNYQAGKMVLIDAYNGWAGAEKVHAIPAVGLGPQANDYMSSSIEVAVNGDKGVEIWMLVSKQGLAYFRSEEGEFPTWTYESAPVAETTITTDAETDFGEVETGQTKTISFTVSAQNVKSALTATLSGTGASYFKLNKSSIALDGTTAEGVLKLTYAPTAAGAHKVTLTLKATGADGAEKSKTVTFNGTAYEPAPEVPDVPEEAFDLDDVTEEWQYSAAKGNLASATWFSAALDAEHTRSMAAAGNNLYVLTTKAWGTPRIDIVSGTTGKSTGTVSLEGVSGGLFTASALATLDGKLLMCNAARTNGYGTDTTTDPLKVYKWDTAAGKPTVWLEDATHGNIHVGELMSAAGTMAAGRLYFSDGKKVLCYTVTNGTVATSPKVITLTDAQGDPYAGNLLNNGMARVAEDADGTLWVTGKDDYPTHFSATGKYLGSLANDDVAGSIHGTNFHVDNINGQRIGTAVTYLENAPSGTASLTGGTMSLIDLNDGSAHMGQYPAAGLGTARNTTFATSLATVHQTATATAPAKLNMYVMVPSQGIAKYSVKATPTAVDDIAMPETQTPTVIVRDGSIEIYGPQVAYATLHTLTGAVVARAEGNVMPVQALRHGLYILRHTDTQGRTSATKVVF